MPVALRTVGDSGTAPADDLWVVEQRRWAHGWRRVVFPSVFLVYLVQVGGAVAGDSRGSAAVAGYAILAVFGVGYVLTMLGAWQPADGRFPWLITGLGALCLAELPFAHADALVMGIYVAAVVLVRYGSRGFPVVVALTILAMVLPGAVPSWHDTFTTGFDNGTAIAIPVVSLAMFAFGRILQANHQLGQARAELARLAAENERTRIARDLHDLLGHSLTTITVKAALAQRLAGHDPSAAAREVAEVETLSREALADVRAAITSYRDVSLANELATGKEVLRAAGIAADVSQADAVVDDATQELFGWVVREGLTNVVRHSRAANCKVRISPASVEIVDDGVGRSADRRGSGLVGLAERVAAAGGAIEAGPLAPSGWRLVVHVASAAP